MKQQVLSRTSLHCNALFPLPHQQFEQETSAPFLIGQYELNESNKELREGRIDLVSLVAAQQQQSSSSARFSLETKCSLGLKCGVFDIVPVWSTSSNQINQQKVAAGCTDGSVKLISVAGENEDDDNNGESTSVSYNISVDQSFGMGDEMVTSCFVHQHDEPASVFIASTHHKGTISILKQHQGSSTATKPFRLSFEAHEYDAWSIAPAFNEINTPESTVFFSGGDDAKLKLWDLRTKMTFSSSSGEDPENTNSCSDNDDDEVVRCQSHCSGFGAGVVSIVPQSANTLLVGSYDEHVYTIDTRMLAPGGKSKPAAGEKAIVSKLRLGGGGWRLREISKATCQKSFGLSDDELKTKKLFAVAAMQAGSEVFSYDTETNELSSVAWPGYENRWIHHTATKMEGQNDEKKEEKEEKEKKQDKDDGEEPLVYDVCQLGQGGKFLGGGAAAFATVSFYTNEVRCWLN